MPIFQCSKCRCVENTAVSNYWTRTITKIKNGEETESPAICSECDPEIGKWHNYFPKHSVIGYLITDQGFLYTKEQKVMGLISSNITIVGEVTH